MSSLFLSNVFFFQVLHEIDTYFTNVYLLNLQVTNQMVTACKEYITDNHMNKIWDQPRRPLIQKLNTCITLNQEYQLCFQKTKQKLEEDPSEKPFEFSEMYIFGKFDTFCRRLQKVSWKFFFVIIGKLHCSSRFLSI